MTCIAAYRDLNGDVYIGGDSIGATPYTHVTVVNPKVFRRKNMVLGFTSSFRMGQILQFDLRIPTHHPKVGTLEYLVSEFIPVLIDKFESVKFAKVEDNQIEGGTFLIGYDKRIFEVEDNFQVLEIANNFNSCGCGTDFASGAFWAMRNQKIKPKDRVTKALECAAYFATVKPPFHIIKLPHDAGLN
jgi:hypothetical protein